MNDNSMVLSGYDAGGLIMKTIQTITSIITLKLQQPFPCQETIPLTGVIRLGT